MRNPSRLAQLLWKLLAIVFVMLGIVGIVVPVLPTVPFLIVAAAAAARGWPWLDRKLVTHPRYGPSIVRWRERRAIARPAKVFATIGMIGGIAASWLVDIPLWSRLAVLLVIAATAGWIWARPER